MIISICSGKNLHGTVIKFKFKMSYKTRPDKSHVIGTSSCVDDEQSVVLNVSLIVLDLLLSFIDFSPNKKKRVYHNVIIYRLFSK